MGQPVAIIGTGGRTAVGLSMPASAAAVRASISMQRAHAFMVDKAGERMTVAADHLLPPELPIGARLKELAVAALAEAAAPLRGRLPGAPLPCWLGLPEARPGFDPARAPEVAAAVRASCEAAGWVLGEIRALPAGHAAGLLALREAAAAIGGGRSPLALAAGVDSWLCADVLEWLDAEERLLSAENVFGFPPGEGAGACLLAGAAEAARRGLPVLAWLTGTGIARETALRGTEDVCSGLALAAAIEAAAPRPPAPAERFDEVLCDINGETYRTDEWGFALLRRQDWFADPHAYQAPAPVWGDVGAASGPLLVGLATSTQAKGAATGPRAFIWCASDGGARATASLRMEAP